MSENFLPLMTPVRPVTHAQWVRALRQAIVDTRVSDCNGDIWTKKRTYADGDLTYQRTNGGWASPDHIAAHAPLTQLRDRVELQTASFAIAGVEEGDRDARN